MPSVRPRASRRSPRAAGGPGALPQLDLFGTPAEAPALDSIPALVVALPATERPIALVAAPAAETLPAAPAAPPSAVATRPVLYVAIDLSSFQTGEPCRCDSAGQISDEVRGGITYRALDPV